MEALSQTRDSVQIFGSIWTSSSKTSGSSGMFRKTRRIATTLLLWLSIAACATSEQALQRKGLKALTGSQLSALFSRDRAVTWMNARTMGEGSYSADGSASMNWKSGSDTGSWRIEGDTFCTTWTTVRTREACFTVYETDDMTFKQFWPDGSWNADFTITE